MPNGYKKPITMSIEEVKRYCQKILPDDSRAQKLMEKALLGDINMEEKARLDELLRQQGFEYEKLIANL